MKLLLFFFFLQATVLFSDSILLNKSKVLQVEVLTIFNDVVKGSAVVISNDGLLVTAYHVIDSSKEIIVVASDGKNYPATVGKVSVVNDLAYLHVEDLKIESTKISLDTKWNEPVYSISGDGLLLKGIIAKDNNKTLTLNYIVPHGNSGGPIFNEKHELIGIISRTSIDAGTTYVIKAQMFASIKDDFQNQSPPNLRSHVYDYSYCMDEKQLKVWDGFIKLDSLAMHEFHALWLGLCEKVKRKELTTDESNYLFERTRDRLFGKID